MRWWQEFRRLNWRTTPRSWRTASRISVDRFPGSWTRRRVPPVRWWQRSGADMEPLSRSIAPFRQTPKTRATTNCGTPRRSAPVFVLGCGRSGTTLLYHMILSAGDFAVYRTESNAINLLEPRFGDLSVSRNKKKLMEAWLDSRLGQLS